MTQQVHLKSRAEKSLYERCGAPVSEEVRPKAQTRAEHDRLSRPTRPMRREVQGELPAVAGFKVETREGRRGRRLNIGLT
jgi:hypothetical protein